MKEKQIIDAVLLEYNRADRNMTKLEFNIRPGVVVMDYVYDDLAEDKGEDPHKKRHNHDPEIMDENTFEAVKEKLYEHNIPFRQRRDEFM
ncbi:hypothetical protein [Salinicoccus albus]|uniref:hypothetical protein n=1 Tax=Salinicoccus albus TaxID=418756 RepID=UPI0003749F86|nr:hypothetical protein [Salinicoccus albus]